MAVISNFGKPDLFITVTCNPQWPEILTEMKETKPSDKLTITARVFRLKLQCIMDDILKKHIFGKVIAMMYVIEFQKRGLPHAHILLIIDDQSKPRTIDDFDCLVSAEIPDKNLHPQVNIILLFKFKVENSENINSFKAWETVTKSMIHGPCGVLNPKSPCMEDGVCSKRFPKEFCEQTAANADGYPDYKRRDNNVTFKNKAGIEVGNNYVIPHNLYLVTKYNCHINVEICSSVNKKI